MKKKPSFLSIIDFPQSLLAECLELAGRLKLERGHSSHKPLLNQTWALLFHKSSTRTRVSFEVGIHELGGHAMVLDQQRMQTGRGESIEDTAEVLSRYVHGLIIRTFEHSLIENYAESASIPVINALTDALHPCQVVSDLQTLSERWGEKGKYLTSLQGRRLAFYGDCASNMANSWVLGGALAGMEIVLCGPPEFTPAKFVDQLLEKAGLPGTYRFTTDPLEAARGADAIYTDVWVSMGDEDERENRLQLMKPYQVNEAVMQVAGPDSLFLHCLPAHPGEEVSAGVYGSSQSIVFDQAENRLHAQKAILSILSKSNKL